MDNAVECENMTELRERWFDVVVFVLGIEIFGTEKLGEDFVNERLYVLGGVLEFDS